MPHFRRSAIEAVGGWDPYNVTEDADLGLKFWRYGYRVDRITRPTYEDAPDTTGIWIRQRTRWLKGWLQTWAVQSRPLPFAARSGRLAGVVVMQILLAGTILSALFFPLSLLTALGLMGWHLAGGRNPGLLGYVELMDWISLTLSFAGYGFLCLRTARHRIRPHPLRKLWALPWYWLLMSYAGWRAVWQYFRDPFLWEKTPHKAAGGESHADR